MKCMDSMLPCYSLLNVKVMVSAPPPPPPLIIMGCLNLKICQNFVGQNYTFISLETANTQKSEVFLLRISSGNVNASVVNC